MCNRVYPGEILAKRDKEKEKEGVYVQMGVCERKCCKSAGVCLVEGVLCVINPASLIPGVLSVWPTEPSTQAPSTPPGHESCLSHTVGYTHTHTRHKSQRAYMDKHTTPPSHPAHNRSLKCCHSSYLIHSVLSNLSVNANEFTCYTIMFYADMFSQI